MTMIMIRGEQMDAGELEEIPEAKNLFRVISLS